MSHASKDSTCLVQARTAHVSCKQGRHISHASKDSTFLMPPPSVPPLHLLAPRSHGSEQLSNKAAKTNHELECFQAIMKQSLFALQLGQVCLVVFYQLRLRHTEGLG
jgi:hypothetical protein